MKRGEWLFNYTVPEVRDAARDKAVEHRARQDYWKNEREVTLAQIRETGVDVRELEVTGGKRAEVVIDATLSGRLNECQQKLDSHQRRADEYEGWERVLTAEVVRQPDEARLILDHEDVRYFGLDAADEGEG